MKSLLFGLLSILLTTQNYSAQNKSENKITDLSIYNLPSKWTTQNGNDIELKDLKGEVLVMVMIYTQKLLPYVSEIMAANVPYPRVCGLH